MREGQHEQTSIQGYKQTMAKKNKRAKDTLILTPDRQFKQQIFFYKVENDEARYEKKLDGHLKHTLLHSQLVKMDSIYLCALVKTMALTAKYGDDWIQDILMISNIIDSRSDNGDWRWYAIDYIKTCMAKYHPYGADIKDRIDDVTAFTSMITTA